MTSQPHAPSTEKSSHKRPKSHAPLATKATHTPARTSRKKEPQDAQQAPPGSLRERAESMRQKLDGARFRWINEQLYTTDSREAVRLVSEDPALFDVVCACSGIPNLPFHNARGMRCHGNVAFLGRLLRHTYVPFPRACSTTRASGRKHSPGPSTPSTR